MNMLSSEAVVLAVEGDLALVEVMEKPTGCGRCHEEGGCGGQSLTHWLGNRSYRYRLLNGIGAQVGERVLVCVPAGGVFKAAALSYLLPTLMVIAGAAIGTRFDAALAGALIGLMVGVLLFRQIQPRFAAGLQPRLASFQSVSNRCSEILP
ncbi:MAG: Fis family transcriptional regulator [Rhodocyclaceae bacterium]|nr:Fis family transcriptional regulator [Rhodocyclaceae bacterium]